LMEACKHCSLGQITKAMFEVGGQYRRNMWWVVKKIYLIIE
jgi:methylmalonyl-CoA mutase